MWFFVPVRRLHRALPCLRLRHKLKHYIKKWLSCTGPHTLYMILSLALILPWVNASCAQSQQTVVAHTAVYVVPEMAADSLF